MNTSASEFEYNLWTELLAFEQTDPDRGAARYLDANPVKPDSIFLFICAADFPFSHRGMEQEYELSPAVCSRNAHPRNEQRERQKWTNWQLRELISNLKKRGVDVYLSMFTCVYLDKFGPEWLTQHPELYVDFGGGVIRFSPISRTADGIPIEQIFAQKLYELCRDYGFAGFHGADRFNSTGMMNRRIANDVMTRFFLDRTGLEAPDYVTRSCDGNPALQQKRMSWIWGQHRREFTHFIQCRWNEFWSAVSEKVHAAGGKCYMNSAYTRGSQFAAGWLGIDYKAVVKAGVDAIVCETVPLSMSNQAWTEPWNIYEDLHWHYHNWCITAMQEIRAYLPDANIQFLHGCKDVVENWDNIRQSPAGYERELFALSSLCHYRKGKLFRAADGLTACLADGFSESDWNFITGRWQSAIRHDELLSAGEMVFVWDDKMVEDGIEDYFYDHFPTAFDTIYNFKYNNFAIQSTARADELDDIREPLCVPVVHLLGRDFVNRMLQRKEPVVLVGRAEFLEEFTENGVAFTDSRCTILVLNSGAEHAVKIYRPQADISPKNGTGFNFLEVNSFVAEMPKMGIPQEMWLDVYELCRKALSKWKKENGRLEVESVNPLGRNNILTRRFADGKLETIVENLEIRNLAVTLQYTVPFKNQEITSSFPFYPMSITENTLKLKCSANRGMCAIEVEKAD